MNVRYFIFLMTILFIPLQAFGWNPAKFCPKTPEDPVKAQMTAGNLFADAESDYKSSRPMKALKGFLCSHRIMPHENTLFNIVQIAKLAEHQTQSIMLLKDFVKHVDGHHITQPIDEVVIDLENGNANNDAGGEDNAPGSEDTVKGDDETALGEPLSDTPDGTSAVDEDGGDISARMASDETAVRQRKLKISGITLLAVGGSALLAGGTFQWLAGHSQQKAADTDNLEIFEGQQDKMGKYQTSAIIGYISGGILFGTGLALTLLSQKNESIQVARLAISPCYGGLILSGRF